MLRDRLQIETIKNQTLQLIEDLRANPKPTYSIDGQTVSWTHYVETLQETVDWCDRKIADSEPFEIHTQGIT